MTIEDLKTLMDEFDLAKLLPQVDTIVGKVELAMRVAVMIGPIVLLLLGLAYIFASPKEANHYFGYRCYFGMGSVDAWRFTQRIAGIVWGAMGLVLTGIMLLVCSSFRGKEIMDILSSAVTSVLWQAGLTAAACLVINILVALRFDSKGELRSRKAD